MPRQPAGLVSGAGARADGAVAVLQHVRRTFLVGHQGGGRLSGSRPACMQATWAADAPAHARPPPACCANLARPTAEQSSALRASVVNVLT